MSDFIACTPKSLSDETILESAKKAIEINPANQPPMEHIPRASGGEPDLRSIAVVTGKRWPSTGVRLTVGFLDNPPSELRSRIISHMNAWSKKSKHPVYRIPSRSIRPYRALECVGILVVRRN